MVFERISSYPYKDTCIYIGVPWGVHPNVGHLYIEAEILGRSRVGNKLSRIIPDTSVTNNAFQLTKNIELSTYSNSYILNNNFGIGTASPARALHINNTGAIRIPVGTTAERGSSLANGDLRYNTNENSIEWYNTTGSWRQPVPVARTPVAGMANRFAKFDASGLLLDTSAVLVQSNGRIGIGTASPTAGFALDVFGQDARINGLTVGRGGGNHTSSVAMGNRALNGSNQYGFNVAIGQEALLSQTGGYYNVAIGPLALKDNTSQSNLIAIGVQALEKNSTGYYNVAIGSNVLGKNTSGNNNAGFGYQALFENTTGIYNLALGALPLYSNTTGSYNIAIGSEALKSNTSATYNAAVGAQALFANTTGANNFALGAFALRNNIDGGNNIAIRNESGRYSTAGTNVSKVDNSIFIGYDARPSSL